MPAMPYLGKYLRDRYEDLDAEKTALVNARLDKIAAGWGESLSNAFDNALTSFAPSSLVSGVNSVRKSLGFQPALSNEARAAQASRAAAPAPAPVTPAQAAAPTPKAPSMGAGPKTTSPAPVGGAPKAPEAPKPPALGKKPKQ